MKKVSFLAILAMFGGLAFAQEANIWRLGLQFGMHGNESKFAGGGANANARFNHESYGSGALNLIGRYDLNNHWMVETGMGINSIGFKNTLSENYSFLAPDNRFTPIESKVSTFEIPLMVSYKFNPNCKNWKWFLSAGVAGVFVGSATKGEEKFQSNDGPTTVVYLGSTTTTSKSSYLHARFAVGREKVYQSGRIFSWAFVWNAGFAPMAKNTVSYTIDSQTYQHDFTNNGNFFGFRLAYYLKPMNTPSAKVNTSASLTK
jgi:hypothetical protein